VPKIWWYDLRVVAVDLESDEKPPRRPLRGAPLRPRCRSEQRNSRHQRRALPAARDQAGEQGRERDPGGGARRRASAVALRAAVVDAVEIVEVEDVFGRAVPRGGLIGDIPVDVVGDHCHRVGDVVLQLRLAVVEGTHIGVGRGADPDGVQVRIVSGVRQQHVHVVRDDFLRRVARGPVDLEVLIAGIDRQPPWRS